MFELGRRSLSNLEGVHPDLVRLAPLALSYSPVDWMITEGLRNMERQRKLVADGFSWTLDSKHLPQDDGYGHAVDVMAVGDLNADGVVDQQDRSITWDRELYTALSIGWKRAAAELLIPIRWGGDFKSRRTGEPLFDGPHFERV